MIYPERFVPANQRSLLFANSFKTGDYYEKHVFVFFKTDRLVYFVSS